MIQANLHNYVTQEVVVPQEIEEEPLEGNLIDTSSSVDNDTVDSASQLQAQMDLISERDRLIQHLQLEMERLR